MQVTRQQASLAFALGRSQRHMSARRRRRVRPPSGTFPTTIEAVGRRLAGLPRVRTDRVAAARARLARGDHPSAEDVAEMMLRRAICDRLR